MNKPREFWIDERTARFFEQNSELKTDSQSGFIVRQVLDEIASNERADAAVHQEEGK